MILDPNFLLKVGLALLCAAVVSCVLTPLVKVLAKKVGAMDIPNDERRMHHVPIPRMGGLAIFLGFMVSVLIFQKLSISTELQGILLGAVIIVILGVLDDIITLHALLKFLVQILAAILVVLQGCRIEHFMGFQLPQWLSYPVSVVWIVAITSAVNFIDGLDGLAILPCVMVGSALGIFAYVVGRPDFSGYLFFPYIPGAGELVVVCAALAGAGLAFLWFNTYPAEVFMGDVGALALGGCLGTVAVITRQEIVLAVMGGIFVVETLSVIIQTTYFRFSHGKRVFLMAPIHHHFELKGWKETQVVVRFWIITFILVLIGLSTLKIR